MGVLDSIIKYKAMEEERQLRDVQAMSGALQNMIQLKQQKELLDLQKEKIKASLSATGTSKDIYSVDPFGGGINLLGTVPKSAEVFKGVLSPEDEMQKMKMKAMGQALGEAEKTKQKVRTSKFTSQYNLNITAEAAKDLSGWLVKGYKEGGAGDVVSAMFTKAAAKGFLPKDIANKYASSASIVGKRNEMLMKMFPMLTQQIGKEGSVRLIESVLSRIGQTLPDTHTPPALAREQLAGTIQSMYRISRALENMDLSQLDINSPTGQEAFVQKISNELPLIELKGKDKESLSNLIESSVSPLDEYLGKKSGGDILSFNTEEEVKKANLKPGTTIIINGKKAVWE